MSNSSSNTSATAAIYIRVSTDKQEELSPDAQKRLILEYAQKNNIFVPNEGIFFEEMKTMYLIQKAAIKYQETC